MVEVDLAWVRSECTFNTLTKNAKNKVTTFNQTHSSDQPSFRISHRISKGKNLFKKGKLFDVS